jgi:hypothetical protein
VQLKLTKLVTILFALGMSSKSNAGPGMDRRDFMKKAAAAMASLKANPSLVFSPATPEFPNALIIDRGQAYRRKIKDFIYYVRAYYVGAVPPVSDQFPEQAVEWYDRFQRSQVVFRENPRFVEMISDDLAYKLGLAELRTAKRFNLSTESLDQEIGKLFSLITRSSDHESRLEQIFPSLHDEFMNSFLAEIKKFSPSLFGRFDLALANRDFMLRIGVRNAFTKAETQAETETQPSTIQLPSKDELLTAARARVVAAIKSRSCESMMISSDDAMEDAEL